MSEPFCSVLLCAIIRLGTSKGEHSGCVMQRVGWWLALGVAGFGVFWVLYRHTFPEASIEMRITPREALQRGAAALRALDPSIDLTGWREAVAFDWDNRAKRYLEKTLGLAHADVVMREEVAVWYFRCRWVREGERTEYSARVAPTGNIYAAWIQLPEEARGARLSRAQAQRIAEQFVNRTLGIPLKEWQLVHHYEYERPNRRDHTFIWQHRTRKYPADKPTAATVRLLVTVKGDRVGGYSRDYLHTPERWAFEQARKQTQRETLNRIVGVIDLLFHGVALGVLIMLVVRRQPLSWRFALRVAMVLAAVYLVTELNFMPLWWMRYDSSRAEPIFLLGQLLRTVLTALLSEGLVWFLFLLVADWLSQMQPLGGVRFAYLGSGRFWLTGVAVRAILAGLGLAGLHLAYVCLFYTVSFRFGAWSPLEVPFTNGVVTPLPFVEPLFYGALPAIQEEIFYRGIVLYLLWRALRRFWLAALLSSALWAFLHGGYPTEPFYMRGLELLPVGLVFCWFALRYGILASISAHYTYNALLTAVVYLQMDAPYLRFSALMSALGMTLLLLPALWVVLRYRQLPSLEAVEIPAGTTAPAPIVREPLVAPYRPLRPADWMALGVVLSLALISPFFYQPDQPDRRRQFQVNRQEAIQIARRYLLSKGADLRGYRAIATFETGTEDELAHQYAKEQGQEKQYQQVEETMREPSFWQIWFFRPLTRIHWYVWVAPNGQVIDFKRVLPEESPEILTRLPSRMNRAQAEKVAAQYLEQELGIDLDEWKLVETDQVRHPNRTDYRFTYEHRRYRLGDAAYRMQVEVQGGLAHNVSLWWDLPESWHYKRKRFQSFWSLLGLGWVILWLLIMVAWVLVVEWREGTFSSFSRRLWWLSFVAGALLIGLAFYSDLETLIWSDYELSMQPRVHLILSLTGLGVGVLVLAGLLALGYAGFEPHYWRLRLGHLVPLSLWLCPSRWATAPADSPLRHPRAWQEGTLIALLIAIVAAFVRYRTDVEMPSVEAQHLWLETVSVAGLGTLFIGMFLLMAVGIYRRYIRSVWRLGVLILLLAPVVLIGADSWQVVKERLQGYFLGTAVGLLISFWLSRRLLQGHLVAWGLTLYLLLLAAIATPLLAVADETIRWQGWLALSFALPPLLVCFMAYRYVQRLQAAQAAVATPTLDAEHAVVQITTPPETPVGEEERQV
jgi:membrane protease YdiL (CAAX protease family)